MIGSGHFWVERLRLREQRTGLGADEEHTVTLPWRLPASGAARRAAPTTTLSLFDVRFRRRCSFSTSPPIRSRIRSATSRVESRTAAKVPSTSSSGSPNTPELPSSRRIDTLILSPCWSSVPLTSVPAFSALPMSSGGIESLPRYWPTPPAEITARLGMVFRFSISASVKPSASVASTASLEASTAIRFLDSSAAVGQRHRLATRRLLVHRIRPRPAPAVRPRRAPSAASRAAPGGRRHAEGARHPAGGAARGGVPHRHHAGRRRARRHRRRDQQGCVNAAALWGRSAGDFPSEQKIAYSPLAPTAG